MIRVPAPPEPDTFDDACRQPGNKWLDEHPNGDPHDHPLWTEYQPALRRYYHARCGFLAMYVHRGTIDHWLSTHSDRRKAYEWDNYRFVAHEVNSAKKPSWEGHLLDPHEVGDDWFEIQLPSLQMVVANVPASARDRAVFTLKKLGLQDREDVLTLRQEWLEKYTAGKLDIEGLRDVAPLLARAVEKRAKENASPPAAPSDSS